MVSDKIKARYDRAANAEGFKEGQLVLLYKPQRQIRLSPKLQIHWEGLYSVIKRINDVVYRIQKYKSLRSKMKVVHLERMEPMVREKNRCLFGTNRLKWAAVLREK